MNINGQTNDAMFRDFKITLVIVESVWEYLPTVYAS